MTSLSLKPSMLFHYVMWACDLCDCKSHLCQNQEKKRKLKIKYKGIKEKKNRIKLSLSFTTLTLFFFFKSTIYYTRHTSRP